MGPLMKMGQEKCCRLKKTCTPNLLLGNFLDKKMLQVLVIKKKDEVPTLTDNEIKSDLAVKEYIDSSHLNFSKKLNDCSNHRDGIE